ncbi:hypothetical protein KJ807_05445 [Patescibacteria group bacterium]|nr:hypothetical protein [Patescibacteria group bacterium]
MADNNSNPEAPFNMAIATLQRLDSIIKSYQVVSLSIDPKTGNIISPMARLGNKLELVKQFNINAHPILSPEQRIEITKRIKSLPMLSEQKWQSNYDGYSGEHYINPKTNADEMLDDIIMAIENMLQRYFMPSAKDIKSAVGAV